MRAHGCALRRLLDGYKSYELGYYPVQAYSSSKLRFGSAHKRFLHNDVSGKDTHSCSEAAFMHALMKLQSRKYVR
jgi:hypothetical protein